MSWRPDSGPRSWGWANHAVTLALRNKVCGSSQPRFLTSQAGFWSNDLTSGTSAALVSAWPGRDSANEFRSAPLGVSRGFWGERRCLNCWLAPGPSAVPGRYHFSTFGVPLVVDVVVGAMGCVFHPCVYSLLVKTLLPLPVSFVPRVVRMLPRSILQSRFFRSSSHCVWII